MDICDLASIKITASSSTARVHCGRQYHEDELSTSIRNNRFILDQVDDLIYFYQCKKKIDTWGYIDLAFRLSGAGLCWMFESTILMILKRLSLALDFRNRRHVRPRAGSLW
jgi:hypothetical protein